MWLYNHVLISIYCSVTSRVVRGNDVPTVLLTYSFSLFIWRHNGKCFLRLWAPTCTNTADVTFCAFSFNCKTRFSMVSSVFRDVPSLRITRVLTVFDHLKIFHLPRASRWLFDLLWFSGAAFYLLLTNHRSTCTYNTVSHSPNNQRWPRCTGPVFRWRRYTLTLR